LQGYQDKKFIRTDYHDVEDYGFMHIVFEDGTIGDVLTSEIVLGGIYDYVEVFGNNHRTRCSISPVELCNTYNPGEEKFKDLYLVEKCSTQNGWSAAAPDENLTMGYQSEIQDFVESYVKKQKPQSDLSLAIDTTALVYAAYISAENNGKEVEILLL
jgi:predicted dehydrogenase